jgi:hypothetical protein
VVEIAGDDLHGAQHELAFGQLVIANRRRQLAERHGEVRVLHLAGEDLLE